MPDRIAIDGPAASGKSTVARMVAARLGGFFVSTGDLYRAVSRAVLDRGVDPRREAERVADLLPDIDLGYRRGSGSVLDLFLDGRPVSSEALRGPEVSEVVSFVAAIPAVREWLRDRQRACCRFGTIVMEGRDIGTVILPDATHKFYLTASPEERARRRLAQGGETAPGTSLAEVAARIAERDRIDSSRAVAPLRPAPDAVIIDTDGVPAPEVAERIVRRVQEGQGAA